MMKYKIFAALALIVINASMVSALPLSAGAKTGVPVPPDGQAYLGVQLDPVNDSVDGYATRLGHTPAVYGRYVSFPISQADQQSINTEISQIAARHAMFMITLEPWGGLQTVTPGSLKQLTTQLKSWNVQGVPVLVRFAHEMDGSWYPWSQQPTAYVRAFQRTAAAVHQAPTSSMLWSPNEGGGYPFAGGPYAPQPGSADFTALDTNHDGALTMADDPYGPYYPGDSAVDWVGLTLYHYGTAWPWGENEVPNPGKLVAKMTGTYADPAAGVDETPVPDFYATYAVGHNKPMAVSETGSFYNSSRTDGASAYDIKSAWWNQIFDPALATDYPKLKLAAWFEYAKKENDTGSSVIDWRVTADPTIRDAYKAAIPSRFLFAP
jgi:beta-mannanase